MVELGERIVAELTDARTNDTLTRWLAHNTARLVYDADEARAAGAPDADARADEAREAILRVWQARSTWPAGSPPPRAAEMAKLLDELPALDENAAGGYRTSVLARLQDIHLHVLGALVDLAIDGDADVEAGWLARLGEQLTAEEAAMLRRAIDRPGRLDALRALTERVSEVRDDLEDVTQNHPLLGLARSYEAAIVEVVDRVTRTG